MFKKYKDVFCGGFLIVLAAVLFILSFGIKSVALNLIKADFFPRLDAALLLVLGMILIVTGMLKARSYQPEAESSSVPFWKIRPHSQYAGDAGADCTIYYGSQTGGLHNFHDGLSGYPDVRADPKGKKKQKESAGVLRDFSDRFRGGLPCLCKSVLFDAACGHSADIKEMELCWN